MNQSVESTITPLSLNPPNENSLSPPRFQRNSVYTPSEKRFLQCPGAPRRRLKSNEDNDITKAKPPFKIVPDMPYGLESISCELACLFYIKYRNKLMHMESRRDVEILYMKTFKSWCPVHLTIATRHVSQIIFALSHYMHACRIFGGKILWYNNINIPLIPSGFPNQLQLIQNVTMRNR